jgi:hypothetical protein
MKILENSFFIKVKERKCLPNYPFMELPSCWCKKAKQKIVGTEYNTKIASWSDDIDDQRARRYICKDTRSYLELADAKCKDARSFMKA